MSSRKSESIGLYRLVRPLLFQLDPERAHRLAIWALEAGLWPARNRVPEPRLASRVAGLEFANPIGLAAGFDKDGRAWRGAQGLGFGFVEVGSVTPNPQPGNPKPRLFRSTRDGAIVNRMGFNSEGAEALRDRLVRARAPQPGAAGAGAGERARPAGLLGINLGKNKDAIDAGKDYATGILRLGEFADYLVVNISSPNTPGLRALQNADTVLALSQTAKAAMRQAGISRPLFLKIAPDLAMNDLAAIGEIAMNGAFDGLIVANTTLSRPEGLDPKLARETGGLSGLPLMALSTDVLRELYAMTMGKVPLIGVGGIADGWDAYAKIRAGASLVQLYSALVFRGPGLVRRIEAELLAALDRDGFENIAQAVGAEHRIG